MAKYDDETAQRDNASLGDFLDLAFENLPEPFEYSFELNPDGSGYLHFTFGGTNDPAPEVNELNKSYVDAIFTLYPNGALCKYSEGKGTVWVPKFRLGSDFIDLFTRYSETNQGKSMGQDSVYGYVRVLLNSDGSGTLDWNGIPTANYRFNSPKEKLLGIILGTEFSRTPFTDIEGLLKAVTAELI